MLIRTRLTSLARNVNNVNAVRKVAAARRRGNLQRPPTADAWGLDGNDLIDGIDGIDLRTSLTRLTPLARNVNNVNWVNPVRSQHSQSCQHRQCRQKSGRRQAAWEFATSADGGRMGFGRQ
jgi:hypothetical protein